MQQTPRLPEALGEYAGMQPARFHMPGHKGRGMAGFFRPELAGWDVTELSVSDNLHAPASVIARAQEECAAVYGAKHTFFLVNGATAGIAAMLLALPQGARLLLGRDCHRSALSGAALAGHACRFVQPAYEPGFGLWGPVAPEALETALCESPADAVLITSPNYYGLCADIPALARAAHEHGALLFVDAAHGAHFPFSEALPQSPAGYADAWVVSAHKTMNALGQAAMLHTGPALPVFAVQHALSMVQTSSPSYLLLASIDWAVFTARKDNCWTQEVNRCTALAQSIEKLLGLRTLPRELIGRAGIADMDATRVIVDVSARGITGYRAARALEAQNVFVELADSRRIGCICTPADDPAWYDALLEALQALPYGLEPPAPSPAYPAPPRVMDVREAARGRTEACPLPECAGRIAADCAGLYPPGIPVWTPGERITPECVALLLSQQALGAVLFGVTDGRALVVCE